MRYRQLFARGTAPEYHSSFMLSIPQHSELPVLMNLFTGTVFNKRTLAMNKSKNIALLFLRIVSISCVDIFYRPPVVWMLSWDDTSIFCACETLYPSSTRKHQSVHRRSTDNFFAPIGGSASSYFHQKMAITNREAAARLKAELHLKRLTEYFYHGKSWKTPSTITASNRKSMKK